MVDDIFFNDCDSIESISLSEIDGDHLDYEADLGTPFSLEYQFYEWLENLDNHEILIMNFLLSHMTGILTSLKTLM